MKRIPILIALSVTLFLSTAVAKEEDSNPVAAISTAMKAGEFNRALELAKTFGGKDPAPKGLEETLFQAGVASVKEMKLEPAAGFYRMLLDSFPESEHASTARAELLGCYNFLRQLDNCILQAKVNLELDPESKWVEYWTFIIAQSHFRLWKFAEAETMLKAFLVKYPDGEYASYARKCLGKINPPWEVDENGLVSYSGKFDGDIRLEAAVKSLSADMDAGFILLEERLGLDLRPHTNALYVFEDGGTKAKPGLKASTYVVGRDNMPAVVMRFYSEFVVSQPENYRQTIIHEMKHAGFQGIMGHAYGDLPQWIREGLAVWGSDDVDTRIQLVLSNKIAGGKDPMIALDGIDDGDRDEADYMEDALAFEWLESKKTGNVKAFCRELAKGKPYREIWENISGMSYTDAMDEANAHCRKRAQAALGHAYAEFLPLRKAQEGSMASREASKKWLDGGGEAAFKKWLTDNPGHLLEPLARFCLARAMVFGGKNADARKLLQNILDKDSLRCTLLDDAQLWIGLSYNYERDSANARAAFGVLLRDFSSSHSAKQVRGKFPAAGPVTK